MEILKVLQFSVEWVSLGENLLGQHKVLSFPRYAQVPHDRPDICCGSITWETSSLLQLLTPTTLHTASPAVPGQLLILPTCPGKSFKTGKNGSKITQVFLALPFSAQLSLSWLILPWLFLVDFPTSTANVPVIVVPILVCQGLDWMHQAFFKSFTPTHLWGSKEFKLTLAVRLGMCC